MVGSGWAGYESARRRGIEDAQRGAVRLPTEWPEPWPEEWPPALQGRRTTAPERRGYQAGVRRVLSGRGISPEESRRRAKAPRRNPDERARRLAEVWRRTHRDYKTVGLIDKRKYILVGTSKGTTLIPLEMLTEEQVDRILGIRPAR